jgi:hypothetical protein
MTCPECTCRCNLLGVPEAKDALAAFRIAPSTVTGRPVFGRLGVLHLRRVYLGPPPCAVR